MNKADSAIITRLFFRMLPVQIILVAVGSVNSIIDGTIASNYIGPIAPGIIGLYLPMLKLIDTVNAVMVGGSQIMCGQFLGRGELDKTSKVFSLDMVVTVLVSAVLSLFCLVMPGPLGALLGADAETAAGLTDYLRAMSVGMIGQMLASQLSVFLQLEQQEKRTYIAIGAMVVSNISLNILFVKVLEMGTFGLGLSTSISSWLFFIIQAAYYFTGKSSVRFSTKGLELKYLKEMIRIGIPGALVQLCLTLRGIALNKIILGYAGNEALSAFSAVGTFGSAYYAVTAGVASATRLLASVYYGEEDRTGLVLIMKTALYKGVALVTGVAAVSVALSGVFTSIFYTDTSSEVYRLTLQYFRIFPLSMPFSAVCVVFNNYYQCSERIKAVNILSVIDGLAGTVVSSLILAPFMGALGIWISQVLGGVYTTLFILIYPLAVNRRFSKSIEDLLVIREDFGVSEDERLDITVRTEDGVLDTAEKVTAFCERCGIDYKRSFYSGLCIEEMAGNIVEHGLSHRRHGSIDIRVVSKSDGILIRFKDTCPPFDPSECEKLFNPEDRTHNIGTRMISRISRKMEYNYVLGLNVLTIVI